MNPKVHKGRPRFHIDRSVARGTTDIYCLVEEGPGWKEVFFLAGAEKRPFEKEDQAAEPLFSIHRLYADDALQGLFDQLYKLGFRPSGKGDQTDALTAHLQDMRRIAFDRLKIAMPENKK